MQNWLIDCATLLQLTGAEVGGYGDYWIDEKEIRGRLDTSVAAMRFLESHEQAFRLSFNRDVGLKFPILAPTLVEWAAEQSGEFQLPDWFMASVNADTAAEAVAVLAEAKAELESRLAIRPLNKNDARSPSHFRLTHAELINELGAIDFLMRVANVEGPLKQRRSKARKGQRNDAVSRDIDRALEELGATATPDEVMAQLKSYAGLRGSSVQDSVGDGVIWRRDNGAPEKLTLRNLKGRMARLAT